MAYVVIVGGGFGGLAVAKRLAKQRGMAVTLVDRPYPQWTIERCGGVRWRKDADLDDARLLADCPALIPDWREKMRSRVSG